MTLSDVRKEIDEVDSIISSALARRAALSKQAQPFKSESSLFSAKRETEIVDAHTIVWEEILRRTRLDLLAGVGRPVPTVLGDSFGIVAGPCSIESREHAFECARLLSGAGVSRMRGGCWKPRTSPYQFQGHGLEALCWMREACNKYGLELWTEVRDTVNLDHVDMIDVAWIGARNSQNFELLSLVGRRCKRVVLKRGAGMTIEEWLFAAEYIRLGGASVALCERGVRGIDPALRNTLDIAGALLAQAMGRYEVMIDPSHATGIPSLVIPLVKAARAAGLSGAIIEVHPRPRKSVTDAGQAISCEDFSSWMSSER